MFRVCAPGAMIAEKGLAVLLSSVLLLPVLAVLLSATTAATASADVIDSEKILQPLRTARPNFSFGEVVETPVEGIYRTEIVGGPKIYITADGQHFFTGDFFQVDDSGLVNLGEQAMERERVTLLSALSPDDMIAFAPEKTRAVVYVFTDVDCYYCQKLHQEIGEINDKGIEVRYLAYPRAGIGSASYKKIASAWCNDNPQEALTQLKRGEEIEENVCADNPVPAQYKLGAKVGVNGTPALVTETGMLLPGYMPADKLANALGL